MATKNDVTTQHASYTEARPVWDRLRDLSAGERAVKAKGQLYLPRPSGMDIADYRIYRERASLFNALGRTVTALSGVLHTRPPSVVGMDDDVRAQLDDVTLRDESLTDVAQWLTGEVLTVGRAAMVLDITDDGRAYWVQFPAESVINWRTARVGNDPSQLVQAVICEGVEVPDASGFGQKIESRYRVLELVDGAYTIRLFVNTEPDENKDPRWQVSEIITPLRRGRTLPFLPLTFCNPLGVTPAVAKAPLDDLADLCVAHFRNSADLEWGLHLVALPTPWASGIQGGDDQPLKIGPSVCWRLSEQGRAGMLEFSGAGLAAIREAMKSKERMMATLGGRLLLGEPSSEREAPTATESRMKYSAESASLRTISAAVSAALSRMARWHSWWEGTEDRPDTRIKVSLTDDFFATRASVQEVATLLQAYNSDALSFPSFYEGLKRAGFAREDVTAEQEQADIRASGASASDESDAQIGEVN